MNREDEPEAIDSNETGYPAVERFLSQCQLKKYLPIFIKEGFDTLPAVYEITEEDMIAMGVKRGHRRLIQREIATAKGIPASHTLIQTAMPPPKSSGLFYSCSTIPPQTTSVLELPTSPSSSGNTSSGYGSSSGQGIYSTANTTTEASSSSASSAGPRRSQNPGNSGTSSTNDEEDDEEEEEEDDSGNGGLNSATSSITLPAARPKRRYRRHPKPDKNAPPKPPSAYVMFSNHARSKIKDQNLTFSDIAKIIGEQWKHLSSEEKQAYERPAMQAKDEYLVRLEQYRQTQEYKKYQEYLRDFKEKQEAANRMISQARPRSRKPQSLSSVADSGSNSNGGDSNGSNGGGTIQRGNIDNDDGNSSSSIATAAANDAPPTMQQQMFLVRLPASNPPPPSISRATREEVLLQAATDKDSVPICGSRTAPMRASASPQPIQSNTHTLPPQKQVEQQQWQSRQQPTRNYSLRSRKQQPMGQRQQQQQQQAAVAAAAAAAANNENIGRSSNDTATASTRASRSRSKRKSPEGRRSSSAPIASKNASSPDKENAPMLEGNLEQEEEYQQQQQQQATLESMDTADSAQSDSVIVANDRSGNVSSLSSSAAAATATDVQTNGSGSPMAEEDQSSSLSNMVNGKTDNQ